MPLKNSHDASSARPLRVVHLSANDLLGGAGRAAFRLHRGLRDRGVDSSMLVLQRESDDPAVTRFQPFPFLPGGAARFLFRLGRRLQTRTLPNRELFASGRTFFGRRLAREIEAAKPDIVHLHWVTALLDFPIVLPRLGRGPAPLVWTFHDMNAFTGGCHYDGGAARFTAECGRCPKLESDNDEDFSRAVFRRKQRAFSKVSTERLTIVCPSRWMAAEARRSTICGRFETAVIPNGIDPDEFAPVDRDTSRRELGLPENAAVVLFIADAVNDQRKGVTLLAAALAELSTGAHAVPHLTALTLGRGEPPVGVVAAGCAHHHLGHISETRKLVLAYSAADVFVIPSLQDNLPNTILEAMACGTPVIGFDTGGMADLIEPGRTGFLATVGNAGDLARQIRALLAAPAQAREMGNFARRRVLESYTVEHQAGTCLRLYERLRATPPARVGTPVEA